MKCDCRDCQQFTEAQRAPSHAEGSISAEVPGYAITSDDIMPLPCPFCGEAPKDSGRRSSPSEERKPDMEFVHWYVCYCGGYGANAHRMAFGNTPEQAQENALARWNVRA